MLNANDKMVITYQDIEVISSTPFSLDTLEEIKKGWFWWCESTIILNGEVISIEQAYAVEKEILSFHGEIEDLTKYERMAMEHGYAA